MDKIVQWFTFQQIRGTIAHTALRAYSRDQLISLLQLVEPGAVVVDMRSAKSIAYQLAWKLLPAMKGYGE